MNLKHLGSAYPLYFRLKTFTIILYGIMILVVGIAGISINLSQDNGDQWNNGKEPEIAVKLSIGQFGTNSKAYIKSGVGVQNSLNFLMIIVIIIARFIFRKYQNKDVEYIDTQIHFPSDF